MHTTSLRVLLQSAVLILALTPGAYAEFATLSHNPATGAFALTIPTSHGTLICSGAEDASFVNMTARLLGSDTEILLSAATDGSVTDVTATFPIGALAYQLGDFENGSGGELRWSTIPAGSCASLDTLPVLSAVREAFVQLQANRQWESTPSAGAWSKVINYLALFFAGTDFASDCTSMAKPQDNYGCDFPVEGQSCGAWGLCCDIHDECYARENCSALSWSCNCFGPFCWFMCQAGGGSECNVCNLQALQCFGGQPVGQSQCCSDPQHPCGSPRP